MSRPSTPAPGPSGAGAGGGPASSRTAVLKALARRAQGSPFTVERAGTGAVVRLNLGAGAWGGKLRDAGLPVAPVVSLDFDDDARTYVLRASALELAWKDGPNPDRPVPVTGGPTALPRVGRAGVTGLSTRGSRFDSPAEIARNPAGSVFAFVDDALAGTGWTRRANTGLAEKKVLVGSIVAVLAFGMVGLIAFLLLR